MSQKRWGKKGPFQYVQNRPFSYEAMKFHIRANSIFKEGASIKRILAGHLRMMPKNSRKHSSSGKAVRDAVKYDLKALLKKL